ncbi:glycerol-3-phosphate 1-O-acyltransferase PlsY [Jannaschia aquimarina]|uniref:Glycerol-3-phosphate acyltransferase n=1 Tax=Jannaschia aquimarina TaxID=935700 RepID=A0A0D1EJE3_9RHOB|nr:glycerol-3-phosphate 1-O-acyltransferase PlsY [Jannaschia aquimarina]KIT17101.1 putative glycerol-3-phosphate acyltransferase [Jannaschia aquimarina]SNS46831.1 acyl-phosphate glycerol-3-phosphate acyltransferase [Jannaschia aquimarina]
MPELVSWPITPLILTALIAYLLGSISFGLISARLFGLGNLREVGSGNTGATNVLRTGSKAAALVTLLGDAGKGAVAVLAARALIGEDAAQLAGLFAFIGHCYPWLGRVKGGKGVATFLGVLLAVSLPLGALACLIWLATAAVMRISSLSALVAAVATPLAAFWLRPDAVVLSAVLAAIVLWRHRENIARLLKGQEPRIGS